MNQLKYTLFYIFALYPIFCLSTNSLLNFAGDNVSSTLTLFVFLMVLFTEKNNNFPKYLKFYLAFLLYQIVSDAIIGKIEIQNPMKYIYSSRFIATFCILYIIENTVITSEFISNCLVILKITFLLAFVVIIIQIFKPHFWVTKAFNDYYKGLNSNVYLPRDSIFNWIGINAMNISFPAIFAIIIGDFVLHNKTNKTYSILGIFISFFSGARSVMVDALIVLIQFLKTKGTSARRNINFVLLIFSLVISSYIIVKNLNFNFQSYYEERIGSKSASTRILAFEVFFHQFPLSPIWGTGGIKTKSLKDELAGRSSQIHVGFLSLFYYYGLIGGSIYMTFLILITKRIWEVARRTNYWGSFYSILTFIFSNMTLVYLHMYEMGLILAFIFYKFYHQKVITTKKPILIISNNSRNKFIK